MTMAGRIPWLVAFAVAGAAAWWLFVHDEQQVVATAAVAEPTAAVETPASEAQQRPTIEPIANPSSPPKDTPRDLPMQLAPDRSRDWVSNVRHEVGLARRDNDPFRAIPVQGQGPGTRVFVAESTPGFDNTPGPMQQTGNGMDVAIEGEGFLAVESRDGGEAYTRAGSLQVGPDGTLQTVNGLTVFSDGSAPLTVPAGAEIVLEGVIHPGETALEGPYGGFDFAAREADGRQVWVAGGIGVTPFLARLRELREKGRRADGVALFYSVRNDAVDAFGGELADLCRATGVQLQRWESDAQGPLPAALIGRQAGRGSSVWFCGPSAWGESLRLWLRNAGLPGGAFHREYFEFR